MYQCNAAMNLMKDLKGRADAPKSPRDVAKKIMDSVPPNDIIDKASASDEDESCSLSLYIYI